MNVILLSGGSGKRLWPLSNDIRSKQFIQIFHAADGGYESMLQRMYREVRRADPAAVVTVAAPRNQISAITNQLGKEVDISPEPCRRDTFPALVLASAYLADIRGVDPEEAVVACPVDPYVESDYFDMLKTLSREAERGGANLVLMGIQPSYPSEKYGYILPADQGAVSAVRTFREKPDAGTAARYIEEGALWNGGVFACRLRYILDAARGRIGYTGYRELFARYESLDAISFDYAVAEREKNIRVVRFGGPWKDLGTWNTLTEAMEEQVVGSAMMDERCQKVHIINELDVPILAMGLRDVVISASPDGILVADREESSYIKPYVDRIDRQVRFAEKSWGSFRVLDADSGSMTIKVTLRAGHRMNYHSHRLRDEVWTVISGAGRTVVDGMEQEVHAGDVITMQAGCRHTVIAVTELKLIEVQLGGEISVYDKQKFAMET